MDVLTAQPFRAVASVGQRGEFSDEFLACCDPSHKVSETEYDRAVACVG